MFSYRPDLFKDFPPIDLTKIDYNNSSNITITK